MRNNNGSYHLQLFFATSNQVKFAHVMFLCQRKGIELLRLPITYAEVQSQNPKYQVEYGLARVAHQYPDFLFIIEQTAVYLDYFGPRGSGPGYYFKHWWRTLPKDELKHIVSQKDGATIESTFGLYIPRVEPVIFTNRVRGHIVLDRQTRVGNEKYDWLSQDDFSKYFVPVGCDKVYNEMDINESLQHDFRLGPVSKICKRLREYEAILQLDLDQIRRFVYGLELNSVELQPFLFKLDNE